MPSRLSVERGTMHGKALMGKLVCALGLMSGTSMDGIDAALIETDGDEQVVRRAAATYPYPAAFRAKLKRAAEQARDLLDRTARPGSLAAVERELTDRHAEAVHALLTAHAIAPANVDVIGFHGHTILHRPGETNLGRAVDDTPFPLARSTMTLQLGDGPLLAHRTEIDVVYDLRAADCAAGGQGAPLVPVYHRAVVARVPERPVAIVNIGGVANVTWIGDDGALLAFDTGPGNALIDDWMLMHAGEACDRDGRAAMAGRVHEDAVRFYLSHSYFSDPAPKSLDRYRFELDMVHDLSVEDGAATLAAFTASAIAKSRELMPEEPLLWIVTGGGRKNRATMTMIAERVHHAVAPAEAVGLDGDSLEAEAWAYLAVRSLAGLPITFPGTTGVPRPMTGGVLARAPRP
jgi:anhydro-N-acetylmuramic acid kinase